MMSFFRNSSAKRAIPATVMVLLCVLFESTAMARDDSKAPGDSQRYIIELRDPPLAMFDGRELSVAGQRLEATSASSTGNPKLNVQSPNSRAYLDYLSARHTEFRVEAAALLRRKPVMTNQYRVALNGLALVLSQAEADILADSPLVKSIEADTRYRLDTYAGPKWIGADVIWNGEEGISPSGGAGIIVGIIDSGINWEHPSFEDPSPSGYNHSNPKGQTLGLCSDPEVECNDKIIGVYDFVEDDVNTEDVVEENNNGRDNSGHGSHVASIAAGNLLNITLNGTLSTSMSGVAPRANIVSYRVCYIGEPTTFDSGGCMGTAILSGIEQAISDGVDVINYSVGSGPQNPWQNSIAQAFYSARSSGIFVATSAGNEGPNPGTIGSPAVAPWVVAVGNASHDKFLALGFDLTGGPFDLACVEGTGPELQSDVGPKPVFHAGDFGDPEGCGAFPPGSLVDSIALIQRGGCLFATKAENAATAGADFMVVYNNVGGLPITMAVSESTIPSCMISQDQGIEAVDFVQQVPGAMGRINHPVTLLSDNSFADIVSQSSSRGPVQSGVEDTMKPNVIAPGSSILAAIEEGSEFGEKSGTSMSSPHVAGSAALLKSVHPGWGPSELASVIETTANSELAMNYDGNDATVHDRGAGRPQLGEAANAGLFLNVSSLAFNQADPSKGGDPKTLNLAGLVDSDCQGSCTFSRTVTDLVGGASWTATAQDFPPGTGVTVNPANFQLANGGSQELDITLNVDAPDLIGNWVSGTIRLSSNGLPDQFLTVSVFSDGGDLPANWFISDQRNGGWSELQLDSLTALPDATFTVGGLVKVTETVEKIIQDVSDDDPYDGGLGAFTKWHSLPEGALWLYAETLVSTSIDLDLFVGRDDDGDGLPEESEELCSSTSSIDLERCDLFDVPPGEYWIVVQNWNASTAPGGDDATLHSAAVQDGDEYSLAASGPGIAARNDPITVRLSWDNLSALPGEDWVGAIGVGTDRDHENNVGVIPLFFNRTGISEPASFPLLPGKKHALALDGSTTHDRIFIDIPPGVSSLTVTASGANSDQNDGLLLEMKRLDFEAGMSNPPFATAAGGAATVAQSNGSGDTGAMVTVSGNDLSPGRWYAVLSNSNFDPSAVELTAEIVTAGTPIYTQPGAWEPNSRPGINQGFEYLVAGEARAMLWFTFDEQGQPIWFITAGTQVFGNTWTANVMRVTNDGASQHLAPVGYMSMTTLAESDALFSFTLFGESGTDRFQPLSLLTCPLVDGVEKSYMGSWFRGVSGLGGASVIVNATTTAMIHYVFDAVGEPRWLVGQGVIGTGPDGTEMNMLQFAGFCTVCASVPTSNQKVGSMTYQFVSESSGSWTLDYSFLAPVNGTIDRTDSIVKLTEKLECQ